MRWPASWPACRFPLPRTPRTRPAVDKLIQMNKKALDDYETLEWDSAKRTLLQALVFGKKSNLETHPMMARTYVHLGAVYIVGFNDKQKGLQSFQRALEIDPTIRISKAMSTPELEDIFAQASAGRLGRRRRRRSRRAEPPPDRGAVTPSRRRRHRRLRAVAAAGARRSWRPSRRRRRSRRRGRGFASPICRRASTCSSARPRTRRRPTSRC